MKKPKVKIYRGYANDQELIVMGHVFKPTKKADYDFRKKRLKNAKSIIDMFRIKTASNFDVCLHIEDQKIWSKTFDDGYFSFNIPINSSKNFGWNPYKVSIKHNDATIFAASEYIKPQEGNLGFISDIDDTFLISHTGNPFKKLYILLFKNVLHRKVFEGVVPHYKALSESNRENKTPNIFFYVSSSEWNLYRFIIDFTELHQLPKAVLLLKDIKTSLTDFFLTGRGNHHHKFDKIKHILQFYPKLKYTLLGDDSQEDPILYEKICKMFPVTIMAVYIRQTGNYKKSETERILQNIEKLNIYVCYFKSSNEAILHSKSIGLI